ncbi:unnamed protein product, partial [Iphiclides podalirius]
MNTAEPMQVELPLEDNENNETDCYVVENPTLDLETYAASYTGFAKLYRLMFVADHCPSLRLEALKMAISYVMTTYNDVDQRSTTFEKSLAMGKEYQRRTSMLILRAAMLKNQIHVKNIARETGPQSGEAPGSSTSLTPRSYDPVPM